MNEKVLRNLSCQTANKRLLPNDHFHCAAALSHLVHGLIFKLIYFTPLQYL
ncbi:hypothetical protein UNSWDHB_981 [Dehalobacter sp. UNSWDHB]|nr:hypothetical protein DCF50_p2791 [Dehalobacter sp. CF]EQB21668.1 hypothetical protein UNSWDHB_981 [Dehalobacter sp. UNSWDHB]